MIFIMLFLLIINFALAKNKSDYTLFNSTMVTSVKYG